MNGTDAPAWLDERHARYAQLAVRGGLNLHAGQRLIVLAPIEAAPFARQVTVAAYQAGARLVDVMYADAELVRARLRHAPRDSFGEYATWRSDALLTAAQRGDAVLSVIVPGAAAGGDSPTPGALATIARASARHTAAYAELRRRGSLQWCSAALPTPQWAARVFPEESAERALDLLWQAVLAAVRADHREPLAGWQEHLERLQARCAWLNGRRYAGLQVSAPGTDLRLGLPEGHLWRAATGTTSGGLVYATNLPTEEVFTLVHREQVEGVVTFARPFLVSGTPVVNARLHFEKGRVVQAWAESGEEQLCALLRQTGAARLGEIALVPASSPLARWERPYHSALLDENTGSHLALGNAYRTTLAGGTEMSGDDFRRAGGNTSRFHVDAVFGTLRTKVDGLLPGGGAEALMRDGLWHS